MIITRYTFLEQVMDRISNRWPFLLNMQNHFGLLFLLILTMFVLVATILSYIINETFLFLTFYFFHHNSNALYTNTPREKMLTVFNTGCCRLKRQLHKPFFSVDDQAFSTVLNSHFPHGLLFELMWDKRENQSWYTVMVNKVNHFVLRKYPTYWYRWRLIDHCLILMKS